MKDRIASALIAALFITGTATTFNAQAQAELSAVSALSALPAASVVVGASAAAGALVAVPVVLSTAGAVLVVKTVESTARGTLYLLERISDGARASIEMAGRGGAGASLVVGASVLVSVVAAGTVLSVAGEAIAFIPNALGRALLHNERLTY
ncbi:MAG: hypothetical protein V4625_17560 [Pseudomonadota bacterium]